MTVKSGLNDLLGSLASNTEALVSDLELFQIENDEALPYDDLQAERLVARARVAKLTLDGLLDVLQERHTSTTLFYIDLILTAIERIEDAFDLSKVAATFWDAARIGVNRTPAETAEDTEGASGFHILRGVTWCPRKYYVTPFLPGHHNPKLWYSLKWIPFAQRPMRPVLIGDTTLFLTKDQIESATLKARDETRKRVKFVDNLDPDACCDTAQDKDPYYDLIPQYVLNSAGHRIPTKLVPDGEGGLILST